MMPSSTRIHCLVAALAIAYGKSAWSEEIRDFYDEPGLHPFKQNISDLNESIDPFSGKLHLSHVDLLIPGNGGMDIAITRYYTSPSERVEWAGAAMGIGWTMHFGRLVVPAGFADRVCAQDLFSVSTMDNPSFERPDGSRELLVLAHDGIGGLISKGNWRMKCEFGHPVVRSPDGMRYELGLSRFSENGDNRSWYVTKIVAPRGNGIVVTYQGENHPYVTSVAGFENGEGDGRLVKFKYGGGDCPKLASIEADGRTWNYEYASMLPVGEATCAVRLDAVVLPTGEKWQYQYHNSLPPRCCRSLCVEPGHVPVRRGSELYLSVCAFQTRGRSTHHQHRDQNNRRPGSPVWHLELCF